MPLSPLIAIYVSFFFFYVNIIVISKLYVQNKVKLKLKLKLLIPLEKLLLFLLQLFHIQWEITPEPAHLNKRELSAYIIISYSIILLLSFDK